jgi:hypothetical protein
VVREFHIVRVLFWPCVYLSEYELFYGGFVEIFAREDNTKVKHYAFDFTYLRIVCVCDCDVS